jgi:plastocyanin
MTLRFSAVLAASVFALAVAGSAAAKTSAHHTTAVNVTAKDFSFKLCMTSVKAGSIKFMIKNDGKTAHDFTIAGHKSKTIQPGKTTTLTVTLKKGSYPYKCTIDSHAKLGMKGVLRVT